MEKKLLPDDIFGPPPSAKKPAPKPDKPKKIDAKPAKKKPVAVKKAAKAPAAGPKKPKAVAKPKPAQKKKVATKAAKPKPRPKAVKKQAKKAPKPAKKAVKAKPKPKPKPKAAAKPDQKIKTTAKKAAKKKAKPIAAKPKPAKKPEKVKQIKAAEPKRAAKPAPEPAAEIDEAAERRRMIEEFRKSRGMDAAQVKGPFVEEDEHVHEDEDEHEGIYERCPSCNEPLPDNAHVCPHCYVAVMTCPYCSRRAGALENPKMATEQRFNRILKQFTLFSPALPSMPVQSILDCSECKSRVIICESCAQALKHTAQSCPNCGEKVRYTKLLINPINILETILRRPDALRGIQRLIEVLISSQSK